MEKEKQIIINGLGESTAKSYAGSYMRLRRLLNLTDKRKPIRNTPLNEVLGAVLAVENPSTSYSVFVITKKLFDYERNKKQFDDADMLIKERKRTIQVKKNINLKQTLPTYLNIESAIKKETDPVTYITSYIMFYCNTRNMDIALADLHASKKSDYDKDRNHLVIDGKNVLFIRNVYKTSKKYGVKENIIQNKKFYQYVKELLGNDDIVKLYSRKDGTNLTKSSIASYLKHKVVLNLNEGLIIKAVIQYANEKGSYDMLRTISQNRGTGVNILLSEYDVSNIKPPTLII